MESNQPVEAPQQNLQIKAHSVWKRIPILFSSASLVLIIFFFAIILSLVLNSSNIYDGVFIQDKAVGGYTKEDRKSVV